MPNGHSHTGQTKESSQAAYVDYGRLVHDAVTAEGEAKTPHEVLSARAETLYVQANELSQMADGLRRQADWKEIEASEIRALADEFVAALARLASVDGDPEVVLD